MARKPAPRFEQFFAIRRYQPSLAFSPDGRFVLHSVNTSGQFNLWRVPVRGGWPQQLTTFEDRTVRAIAPSPDGKTIAFLADHNGDEMTQIFAIPSKGGWPEQWTDAPPPVQHMTHEYAWSPDGDRLAFAANSRDPMDTDVWVRDIASGEVRMVIGGGKNYYPISWAPDAKSMLVYDYRSNTDGTILLVDLQTEETVDLTPHEGEVGMMPGPWKPDGSGFWFTSDEGREFQGLAFYKLAERRYEWVDTPDWDVTEVMGSRDGRVLAYLVNEDGYSRVVLRDANTGAPLPEPKLPKGCAHIFGSGLTFSPDGRLGALMWQQPQRPAEIYVFETATGRTKRITDGLLGGLAERDLVAPELIRYPTFDAREIPAWVYRPRKRGRVPAVLLIHGGPEAQERPLYNPFTQYLLSQGIGVVATNIRGSTGYGKTYQKLIHRDWMGGDLKDLDHAVKWMLAQEWVDPKRLGVIGGSYGGFATLMCVTRLPQYWAAAVDIVGPSNLVTFAKAVPPTWRRLMAEWVGDPETEVDFLMARSPITYVASITAPLLVMQGAMDPRVVKAESDQMVERLRDLGREVDYVVFEDEGHGWVKRHNELRGYRLAAEWFERHLLRGKR